MPKKVCFDTIVTHHATHFDEYVTIFLLRKWGEKMFPGISTAKIVYVDSGSKPFEDLSVDEWEKRGKLAVGVWGSRFDEHPITANSELKKGECSATLAAKELGLINDPSLEKILRFATNNDLNAAAHPFDLAYIIKLLHSQYPNEPDKVMDWVMMGIEAKYWEQSRFFTATMQEFKQIAKIEEIRGPDGRLIKMTTILSDNEQMNKFARSEYGGCAAIVLQKRSSGNVQIHTNNQFGIRIHDIAQMINLTEQEMEGDVRITDWKILSGEGVIPKGKWFFHYQGQMLLNGSLTALHVPPTKLSLEQIESFIRIALNLTVFETKRASECGRGNCVSKENNPCPWYKWGLHRCRKIRFNQRNRKRN